MCGIFGFFGDFDYSKLDSVANNLSHRGPDDRGIYSNQKAKVALVHTRLAIIDLSPTGHQPMICQNDEVVIVFNGEIYNFLSLRSELLDKGYVFRGDSDTEVLLNLYLEFGEHALKKLNGIFSFAIWDSRSEKVLLARDALGVKPLYWAKTQKGVVFASEIKAMIDFLPSDLDFDPIAVHQYLGFLWCPGERTALSNVSKLQPGEVLELRKGELVRKWSWYTLPNSSDFLGKKNFKTTAYWIDETTSQLRNAVHRQMVADVPVGAFLSGGLDSSAIVSFAKELNPDIRCFSIDLVGGQDEGSVADLPYARRVASHLNLPLDIVRVDSNNMAANLEKMVYQLDEPLADPAALNVLFISQLARDHGIKVLLSGAGGDDLFTGYRRHRALQMSASWRWMPAVLLKTAERSFSSLNQRKPHWRKLSKLFNGSGLSGDSAIANYFVWSNETQLFQLYSPQMKSAVANRELVRPMLDFLSDHSSSLNELEKMLLLEQRFFLADHNLNYTDKMSMAVGVETRVPFLDLDLVSFAASLPMELKQRGRHGKWILKKAMEPYLPKDIIYRTKTGFGAPLRRWMKNELAEIKGDMLSKDSLAKRNIFDGAAVQKVIEADTAGKVDASYLLFSVMCIEIWCRQFLDRAK